MSESIEEQIKQRQEEGRALFYPAKMAALHLGRRHPKKHGAVMIFSAGIEQEYFKVHYDTYAPNLSVYDRDGNTVLCFHLGRITKYIPGPWVDCLKVFADNAIEYEEKQKEEAKRERERKRLEDWGL